VDGFHAEANAALASLRASLAAFPSPEVEPEPEGDAERGGPAPWLALAEPRSGPTPRRRSSNARSVSRTDPDARLRGKPGQRSHLVHRGQVAVDPKARCVVACRGEGAGGFEGDALVPLVERARFACPELASIGADCGFAAERVWRELAEQGLVAYIPPQPQKLPRDGIPASEAQRLALEARARCKSERGIRAHKRRMADAEGVISELKNEHGLARARSRGTPLFHLQLLVGCAAINYKRLAEHTGEATSGVATGAQEVQTQLPTAVAAGGRTQAPAADVASPIPFRRSAAHWSYRICLN
jgi:hypothetical protein